MFEVSFNPELLVWAPDLIRQVRVFVKIREECLTAFNVPVNTILLGTRSANLTITKLTELTSGDLSKRCYLMILVIIIVIGRLLVAICAYATREAICVAVAIERVSVARPAMRAFNMLYEYALVRTLRYSAAPSLWAYRMFLDLPRSNLRQ